MFLQGIHSDCSDDEHSDEELNQNTAEVFQSVMNGDDESSTSDTSKDISDREDNIAQPGQPAVSPVTANISSNSRAVIESRSLQNQMPLNALEFQGKDRSSWMKVTSHM